LRLLFTPVSARSLYNQVTTSYKTFEKEFGDLTSTKCKELDIRHAKSERFRSQIDEVVQTIRRTDNLTADDKDKLILRFHSTRRTCDESLQLNYLANLVASLSLYYAIVSDRAFTDDIQYMDSLIHSKETPRIRKI